MHAEHFPAAGTHLARYAEVFTCAEINSSFYRPHRGSTYARWAASTPDDFRFSVKAPKSITHECALAPAPEQLQSFLSEVSYLGDKLGPILLQLPPRQGFSAPQASAFFSLMRELYPEGAVALEPRHREWFGEEAEALLQEFSVARVSADPPRADDAIEPEGSPSLAYYRLHGSPRTYYSSYTDEWLEALALSIHEREAAQQVSGEVWCIFDNTALGAAIDNALCLMRLLR